MCSGILHLLENCSHILWVLSGSQLKVNLKFVNIDFWYRSVDFFVKLQEWSFISVFRLGTKLMFWSFKNLMSFSNSNNGLPPARSGQNIYWVFSGRFIIVCKAPIFLLNNCILISIYCEPRWRYMWAWDPKWEYNGVNKQFVL